MRDNLPKFNFLSLIRIKNKTEVLKILNEKRFHENRIY